MEYRALGTTGLSVSALCLGVAFRGSGFVWSSSPDQGRTEDDCVRTIERAVELGCNFIDCANFYGRGTSEEILGRTVKQLGGRDQLIITSKVGSAMGEGVGEQGLSRRHIMHEVEMTLRRLQMDYVDVYFLHQPDPHTPLDDTLRAMHDIVQQGKARYIGVSNHVAAEIVELLWTADRRGLIAPSVLQYQYSLVTRRYAEEDILPLCDRFGLGLMTFSPLAIGLLTGQVRSGQPIPEDSHWYQNPQTEAVLEATEPIIAACVAVAEELGRTPAQVALAWLLAKPAVSAPIIGPELPEHVDELFGAVGWQVPPEAIETLDSASEDGSPRRLWQSPGARQQVPPRR